VESERNTRSHFILCSLPFYVNVLWCVRTRVPEVI